MHDSKLAELKAKVEATNKAHVEFHRLRPILLEAFRPLIGQKVRKVDATGKFVWSRPRNGVHHRVGFYAQYFDYTLPDEREE